MNEALISLVVNTSQPHCDRENFVDCLNKTISSKFESRNGDNPLKAVFLMTLQTSVVWISDINSADYLVSLGLFLMNDGINSVLFDFPNDALTSCVEISSKNRTSNDIEYLENVFDRLVKRHQTGVKLFKSNFRIVCKFDSVEAANEARDEILGNVQPDESEGDMKMTSCCVRQLAVKDLALLRCYFRGTKKPFNQFERDWRQTHTDQTISDYVQTKLSQQLKENPCILSVQATLESTDVDHAIGGRGEQDLHIVCTTNYDLRLLTNYSRGTVALSDQERITFRSNTTSPTTSSGIKTSSVLPIATAAAPPTRSKAWISSEETPATFTTSSSGQALLSAITAKRSKPRHRQAYIFW
jgi:hypothetical protein